MAHFKVEGMAMREPVPLPSCSSSSSCCVVCLTTAADGDSVSGKAEAGRGESGEVQQLDALSWGSSMVGPPKGECVYLQSLSQKVKTPAVPST